MSTLLAAVGLVLCAYVGVLLLADAYLIIVHLCSSRRQVLEELHASERRAERPEPAPLVCVQVPIFNEAALVGPVVDSLCALSWPHERLEIMILDDSTDETSAAVSESVAHWQTQGFAIKHVLRRDRTDFKAGALSAGLQHTGAQYLAIFDVDYRPPPYFLRDMMPALLAEPRLAFVQARLDYRNRNRNMLTRAQALELDTLLAYEQAARSWAGIPLIFNGTCGIWRRKAIEEAGGWSGKSLAEDQDLSFRAFGLGWRSRYLVSVSAEGELPESFGVLVPQRQRWSMGTAQTFRDLPWSLLRELHWHQAAVFILLTLFYASTSAVLVAILAILGICWLIEPLSAAALGYGLVATVAFLVIMKSLGAALATHILGRPLGVAFVCDVVAMWLMQIALLPISSKALVVGYLTRQMPFLRTPKKGR